MQTEKSTQTAVYLSIHPAAPSHEDYMQLCLSEKAKCDRRKSIRFWENSKVKSVLHVVKKRLKDGKTIF